MSRPRRIPQTALTLAGALLTVTACGRPKDSLNGNQLHALQPGNCDTQQTGPANSTYWADPFYQPDSSQNPPNVVTGTAVLTEQDGTVTFCLAHLSVSPPADITIHLIEHGTADTAGDVEYSLSSKQETSAASFVAQPLHGVKAPLGYAIVFLRSKPIQLAVTSDTGHFPS